VSGEADAHLAQSYTHCESLVREHDYDRWLAGLFAPVSARPHLYALYAFSFEVARVRDLVSEPLLGEVRHQWWRDVIAGTAKGSVEANPVAAALLDTMGKFHLPPRALVDLVEARSFDLYDDPMPTLLDLEGYCGETSSSPMRLASLILAGGEDPGGADAVGHAGVAYAITGLLRALPWHAARGQVYLPADVLGEFGITRDDVVAAKDAPNLRAALGTIRNAARDHVGKALAAAASLRPDARPAILPVALVPLYLDRMDRQSYQPFQTVVEVASWRRTLALWRLSRRL
jgi:phytoene synthase